MHSDDFEELEVRGVELQVFVEALEASHCPILLFLLKSDLFEQGLTQYLNRYTAILPEQRRELTRDLRPQLYIHERVN